MPFPSSLSVPVAKCLVACVIAALVWWGVTWLDVPPIYRLVRSHNALLFYQGHILIGLAVLLAWWRDWAAHQIVWLGEKLHRWTSALTMLGVVGVDASLHILSIPHIEGWWVPILGGSSVITGVLAYLSKWRHKPCDSISHDI
jgi:hypothetical protein